MKKRISLALLLLITFSVGSYFSRHVLRDAWAAIQYQVGVNALDGVTGSWIPNCRQVMAAADGVDRAVTPTFNCGIQDNDAAIWYKGTTTLLNAARDVTGIGDGGSTGIGAQGITSFNGVTWDRIRSFSNAADTLATNAIGNLSSISFPFVFNGTTFDRIRDANIVNATAGTGIPANGIFGFALSDSLYHRIRVTADGDPYVSSIPIQSGINNSQTTGAANTAVAVTLTASATQQVYVHSISARCSAGTASLTVTNGTSTVWSTNATEVGTATFEKTWNTALSSAADADPVITLSTCGVGNTGTLIVQASIRTA
jgi:hypothetical protein